MKTLFKQPFPMLVATIVTTATLAACSGEMNPIDVSPGEPQAVAVHFTTPSTGQAAAENPWQENDQVTVTPEAAPDGAITFGYTKQEDTWQNILPSGNSYFKAILPAGFTAYCPTTEGASSNAFTLPNISGDGQTEKADQSDATKLRAADYMTAPITTVAQVGQALYLTLAHRLCRLTFIVTEYGNEFNGLKPELTEVKIKSRNRTVALTYEGDKVVVATTTGNPVWVSPLIATNATDQSTYTVIVTPCDLTSGDMELMSLTVNGTPLQVKYKGDLAALVSGNAYTFHLQVGKDYVTVTESSATEWKGSTTGVESKVIKQGFAAADLKTGDYYYSDGTWSDGGYREYTDGSKVTLPIIPVLTNPTTGAERTVLGIVLKAGRDDEGKWNDDCLYRLKDDLIIMNSIRGYVLSLHNPNGAETWKWTTLVPGWRDNPGWVGNIDASGVDDSGFYGYKYTRAIKRKTLTLQKDFPATYYATEVYEATHPAPDATSDWFLPSAGQCQYWLDNKEALLTSIKKATGNDSYQWENYYWSSSEYIGSTGYDPENYVWYLHSNSGVGYVTGVGKADGNYARSVLAF